ncbi:hypothetical protein J6590_050862 [Homalodisca vitripennis]|nr:hypothetical protein J6590_050862 [Homalodisca vitripennis]
MLDGQGQLVPLIAMKKCCTVPSETVPRLTGRHRYEQGAENTQLRYIVSTPDCVPTRSPPLRILPKASLKQCVVCISLIVLSIQNTELWIRCSLLCEVVLETSRVVRLAVLCEQLQTNK